jgi:hypothetical protein
MELTQPVRILMYLFFPVLFFSLTVVKKRPEEMRPPKTKATWAGMGPEYGKREPGKRNQKGIT